MSLIIKVPNVTFSQALPKLYRDAVIGIGTQFVYDALNTVSWAKQAAPMAGAPSADKWVNLVDGTADGLFYSVGGWSGGFSSNSGVSDKITLKNGVIPTSMSKCLGIVWFKHGAVQTDGQTNASIASFSDLLEIRHATAPIASPSVSDNRFYALTSGSAIKEIPGIDTSAVGDQIFQIGVAYDNATRKAKAYVNGALAVVWDGYRDLAAPTIPFQLMQRTGVASTYVGTFYRALFDDLSDGRSPDEIVALDYALNNSRFV